MKNFHMIAGLPRTGSSLLCQILNSNKNFHVTPTSGVLDMLKTMRANFSQNPTWRAQDRLEIYDNFQMGLKGFIEGFFHDVKTVFDKNRGWPGNIKLIDTIFGHENSKIIWLYRNPVDIISSIEHQYQKTWLLENMDESVAPGAFSTLDRRISTYAGNDGIIANPIESLKDALEMGYQKRILIIKYVELTTQPKLVLDAIHDFIGEKHYDYDFSNIKQTTHEFDGVYNYKFLHSIKEGPIEFKRGSYQLEDKFIMAINDRFAALNKYVLEGDYTALLNLPSPAQQPNVPKEVAPEQKAEDKTQSPFVSFVESQDL